MGTVVLFDYKQQDHQVGGLAWPCRGQGGAAGVGPGPWGPARGQCCYPSRAISCALPSASAAWEAARE